MNLVSRYSWAHCAFAGLYFDSCWFRTRPVMYSALLREGVPYVKLHRCSEKHLYPKLNDCGNDGLRNFKGPGLLYTYWLPNTYPN